MSGFDPELLRMMHERRAEREEEGQVIGNVTAITVDTQAVNKLHLQKYKWAKNRATTTFTRAKKCGLAHNLTPDYLYAIAPVFCPVMQERLDYSFGGRAGTLTASVDKIIPEVGYVKGNVQVISMLANRLKSNASPEELRAFARWVLDNEKGAFVAPVVEELLPEVGSNCSETRILTLLNQ